MMMKNNIKISDIIRKGFNSKDIDAKNYVIKKLHDHITKLEERNKSLNKTINTYVKRIHDLEGKLYQNKKLLIEELRKKIKKNRFMEKYKQKKLDENIKKRIELKQYILSVLDIKGIARNIIREKIIIEFNKYYAVNTISEGCHLLKAENKIEKLKKYNGKRGRPKVLWKLKE